MLCRKARLCSYSENRWSVFSDFTVNFQLEGLFIGFGSLVSFMALDCKLLVFGRLDEYLTISLLPTYFKQLFPHVSLFTSVSSQHQMESVVYCVAINCASSTRNEFRVRIIWKYPIWSEVFHLFFGRSAS